MNNRGIRIRTRNIVCLDSNDYLSLEQVMRSSIAVSEMYL